MNKQNYFVDTSWTWRERLRFKLFPSRHCELPEAPAAYADCIVNRVHARLDVMDRLRVLFSGHLIVETKIVTQNVVGDTISSSVVYPVLGLLARTAQPSTKDAK